MPPLHIPPNTLTGQNKQRCLQVRALLTQARKHSLGASWELDRVSKLPDNHIYDEDRREAIDAHRYIYEEWMMVINSLPADIRCKIALASGKYGLRELLPDQYPLLVRKKYYEYNKEDHFDLGELDNGVKCYNLFSCIGERHPDDTGPTKRCGSLDGCPCYNAEKPAGWDEKAAQERKQTNLVNKAKRALKPLNITPNYSDYWNEEEKRALIDIWVTQDQGIKERNLDKTETKGRYEYPLWKPRSTFWTNTPYNSDDREASFPWSPTHSPEREKPKRTSWSDDERKSPSLWRRWDPRRSPSPRRRNLKGNPLTGTASSPIPIPSRNKSPDLYPPTPIKNKTDPWENFRKLRYRYDRYQRRQKLIPSDAATDGYDSSDSSPTSDWTGEEEKKTHMDDLNNDQHKGQGQKKGNENLTPNEPDANVLKPSSDVNSVIDSADKDSNAKELD